MPEARRPVADDMPELMQRLGAGESLRGICADKGLHAPSVLAFIDADDRLGEQYARTRAIQGDGYGLKVADVAQDILDKKVAPDVGKAAMDGFKWTAARMASKRWGDKQQHEHTGANGGPIQMDLSRLSEEDLNALEMIAAKASAPAPAEPAA